MKEVEYYDAFLFSFQNGVVYGYAPGIVPTKDQILDQKILP